jgi:hypothetical protein
VQKFYAAWEEHRRRQPFYVRHEEEIIGYACFAGATWFLWALLRAVGTRGHVPSTARPPTCETCGYNLTAAPMEGRCPECGDPVVNSLGPGVRPGTPWQRRREVGFRQAWWRCCVDPVVRPSWFGRQVQVTSDKGDHRWFLAMHLAPVFVVGAIGIGLCYVADTGRNPLREREMILAIGPLAGYLTAALMLLYAMFGAGLLGILRGLDHKRNLMSATMQMASYLSGYVMLWAVFAGALGAVVLASKELFHGFGILLRIPSAIVAFFAWLLPNAACGLVYLLLLSRGAAAARYANR